MTENPPLPRSSRLCLAAFHFIYGWFAALMVALGLYFLWERTDYSRVLNLSVLLRTKSEQREVLVIIVSKTVLLLTPSVALGALVHFRNSAGGPWVRSGLFFLVLWLLLLDRSLFLSVGRHLTDLWAFRHVPHRGEAAGNLTLWALSVSKRQHCRLWRLRSCIAAELLLISYWPELSCELKRRAYGGHLWRFFGSRSVYCSLVSLLFLILAPFTSKKVARAAV